MTNGSVGRSVVANSQSDSTHDYFVIRPNNSLSWRATKWFFLVALATSLTIATSLAIAGAWMVFPFAGLEMAALATVLYIVAKKATRREVIKIDADSITVSRGRHTPEEDFRFERVWARVEMQRARLKGYPSRLVIRSHGREVEVGSCLCEEERERLATRLIHAIA